MASNRKKPDPLHLALRQGYDAYRSDVCDDGEDSARSLGEAFGRCRDWVYDVIKGATSFRLIDLPQWIQVTGDYHALEWVCKQVGVIPVRVPNCAGIGCTAVTVREFAGYLESVATAAEDGRVTADEARVIRERGEAAVAAILAEIGKAEAMAGHRRPATLRDAS
jgi:hypothetical protein